ncbi:cobalt-precorrin-4/precorrin-4 C(11)-methyltransferase [Halodesulfurarchaeum formicicum]|uniref:Precorrin-4/cobalt-precorrin-4 C11-methyltransferase n=1 Tax=Halodesulfurarchaeum formicicum TaxID=1873524 RepID=A0A1J1AF71_9EURY|nr:SAM-dependent methyltransferase [Halodesulfurarchaeum formicicum]APE96343.1 precorrin-4/cobalt-precorrin-4 C11-methyltransferase [Halodesulfurarchaeum formicicum]
MSGVPWQQGEAIPFVGAGPGNPELITVAGREALEGADLVVHAGSLVNSDVLVAYAPDARWVDSAGKDLETLVETMATAYEDGEAVVRLHSGDPSIFGAALEQIDALAEREIPAYVIPGVTAAFAASATLGTQLTLSGIANHVAITRPRGKTLDAEQDHVTEFVGMGDVTTAVYLGTHAIEGMMDRLLEAGEDPETPVAVVYHASWPDEDVIKGTISDITAQVEAAGYQASALVLIGEAVTGGGYDRSHLYGGWATDAGDDS